MGDSGMVRPLSAIGCRLSAIGYPLSAIGSENHTTAPATRWKHTPFWCLRHHLPPR